MDPNIEISDHLSLEGSARHEKGFSEGKVPLDHLNYAAKKALSGVNPVFRISIGAYLVVGRKAAEIFSKIDLPLQPGNAYLWALAWKGGDVPEGNPSRRIYQLSRFLSVFNALLKEANIDYREILDFESQEKEIMTLLEMGEEESLVCLQLVGYYSGTERSSQVQAPLDPSGLITLKADEDEIESMNPLIRDALYLKVRDANAFNGSIEIVEDEVLVAYRYYDKASKRRNRIVLSRIDGNGCAVDRKGLELDYRSYHTIKNFRGIDDPRLFYHDGRLFCSISTSSYPPYRTKMLYGEIVERGGCWKFASLYEPNLPTNSGGDQEKNWQFFGSEGNLYVAYDHHKGIFFKINGDLIEEVIHSLPVMWNYGTIRGGTPPRFFSDGLLITFFHSFTSPIEKGRIYHMGALVFEAKPPFNARMISSEPILTGQGTLRNCGPFQERKVVFPCGAFGCDEGFIISLGVNDCDVAFIELSREEMNLEVVSEVSDDVPDAD